MAVRVLEGKCDLIRQTFAHAAADMETGDRWSCRACGITNSMVNVALQCQQGLDPVLCEGRHVNIGMERRPTFGAEEAFRWRYGHYAGCPMAQDARVSHIRRELAEQGARS